MGGMSLCKSYAVTLECVDRAATVLVLCCSEHSS